MNDHAGGRAAPMKGEGKAAVEGRGLLRLWCVGTQPGQVEGSSEEVTGVCGQPVWRQGSGHFAALFNGFQ